MMANRPDELPPRSQQIFAWFRWYCRRYYFPAHFHALRLLLHLFEREEAAKLVRAG